MINNVDVEISVVLGQSNLRVQLEQHTSDPVEIYANGVLIERGEVVVTSGDKIGIILTELVKSMYSKMAGK